MARLFRWEFDAEHLLNTIQALALIIGGCWVLFRYFEHDQKSGEIDLGRQRLAYEQSAATLKTQISAAGAGLRQLELSNRQAEIALETQRSAATTSLRHQALMNDLTKLNLEISRQQRELRQRELETTVAVQQADLELKKLEQAKNKQALDYSSKYRFAKTFELTGKKLRDVDATTAEYELTHSFTFTNRSAVPFEMSLFILDYYLGTPKQRLERKPIEVIGTPADRWNPMSAQQGAFRWELIDSAGSILAAAAGSIKSPWDGVVRREGKKILRGGAGTALLRPEQDLIYSDTYLVTAPKDAYVAFMMSYCFERCATNEDLYSRIDWISMSEIDTTEDAGRLAAASVASPNAGGTGQ